MNLRPCLLAFGLLLAACGGGASRASGDAGPFRSDSSAADGREGLGTEAGVADGTTGADAKSDAATPDAGPGVDATSPEQDSSPSADIGADAPTPPDDASPLDTSADTAPEACQPATCLTLGATCGAVPDGCGGTLTCGTCASGQVCGGAGPNQCGTAPCVPATCGASCGVVSDNCGGTLDCGSCTLPQTCGGGGVANACGCTPTTCLALHATCGTLPDGCGGTLSCGTCTAPSTCGGGGTPNACSCAPESDMALCAASSAACGALTAPDNCGTTRTVASCGMCATGLACAANACVPAVAPPTVIFPIAAARVTGLPALKWVTAPGATDSVVDVCRDPACMTLVAEVTGVSGASLTTALPRGPYFLKAFGRLQQSNGTWLRGATSTPVRAFFSTGVAVPSGALLGIEPDLDVDGRGDMGRGDGSDYLALSLTTAGAQTFTSSGDDSFAALAAFVGDTDGDGIPEIVSGSDPTVNPFVLVRDAYDPVQQAMATLPNANLMLTASFSFVDVVALGDVNGDGYADVGLVWALPPTQTNPSMATGAEVDVLFGSPAGLTQGSVVTFQIPVNQRPYGDALPVVRGVGDVNGDGYADLSVGLPTLSDTTACTPPQNGYVDVFAGSPAATFTTSLLHVVGPSGATPLGDVNGDGFPDVGVTMSPYEQIAPVPPSTNCAGAWMDVATIAGQVQIFYGGATLPLASNTWAMPIEIAPNCYNETFGISNDFPVDGTLVGGGDLDGDGHDDMMLVSGSSYPGPASTPCGSNGPIIRVLYGGATGGALSVAQSLTPPNGAFDPYYGSSVKVIGDYDGVGRDEAIVAELEVQATVGQGVPASVRMYSGTRGALAVVHQVTNPANPAFNSGFADELLGGL